jgi:hypothetical protein
MENEVLNQVPAAKAAVIFGLVSARLKPRPFKTHSERAR